MEKKTKKRQFKLDTARVTGLRLVSTESGQRERRIPDVEHTREIVLKLIEAIKRL